MCLRASADSLPYRGRQNSAQRRGGEHQRGRRLLIDEDCHHAAEKTADPYCGQRIDDRADNRAPRTPVVLG